MTFTRTFTFTPTATVTQTFTKTSTPSFTITTTGTPSGQRIKEQQVEGFLTAVPTTAPAATSVDLFTLQKMFSAQFERIAHGGSAGNWYDDVIPQYPLNVHVEDTADVAVGNPYALWQFPWSARIQSFQYSAITPSGGGGSETFELTDGSSSVFLTVPSGGGFSNFTTSTMPLGNPSTIALNLNATSVGTTAAKVTFTVFYIRE